MAPLLRYGDYVGGCNIFDCRNKKLANGDLVFIFHGEKIESGLYEEKNGSIILKNFLGEFIEINPNSISSLGMVEWISRCT